VENFIAFGNDIHEYEPKTNRFVLSFSNRYRKWTNLPPYFADSFRIVCPSILPFPWFHKIPIPRRIIVSFSRLRFGHGRLPAHSYYLSLNDSPLHDGSFLRNSSHLLFNRVRSFLTNAQILFNLFASYNIPFTLHRIFQSSNAFLLHSLINFFLSESYIL